MVVRSHSEFGPEGPGTKLPAESTLAAMAMERMQATQLEDTRLRPDLVFPPSRSTEAPRSILCVPLSLAHGPAGALEAYASQPRRWTEQQVQLLQWLGGQCSRAWESVRLRDELGREQARLRTLADAIPQLAWMAEPDGHIFWYNRRWYQYTGTTPEQMEGWGWQSVHDPEVLPKVLEQWKASLATGEPFDMIFPLRGADGVLRPFLTRSVPLKDEEGRVLRWFGTNTDVSEQKLAEETLRQSEADLTEAQCVAHVGSWHWDAKTDAITGSEELLRIFGLDPATQRMPAFREQDGRLYSHESWQRVNAAIQGTFQTGVGYELDVEAICDGATIWITTRGEAARDANGRIVGLRGTVQGHHGSQASRGADCQAHPAFMRYSAR